MPRVELSRKNNADAIASGRAEILEGNVAALPWPDNRFSAGASANMFFFVPEPQKALLIKRRYAGSFHAG